MGFVISVMCLVSLTDFVYFSSHCDLVELLIEHGASVNAFDKRDRRALHWASYMGHESVVKILLQNGAEVNIRDKDLYSPLHAVISQ